MLDNVYFFQLTVNTSLLCVGTVNITLSDGKQIGVTLGSDNSMPGPNSTTLYTTLYTNAQPVGNIMSATVTSTLPLTCVPLKIQIKYMSNLVAR